MSLNFMRTKQIEDSCAAQEKIPMHKETVFLAGVLTAPPALSTGKPRFVPQRWRRRAFRQGKRRHRFGVKTPCREASEADTWHEMNTAQKQFSLNRAASIKQISVRIR
jgi:hypothetical protein